MIISPVKIKITSTTKDHTFVTTFKLILQNHIPKFKLCLYYMKHLNRNAQESNNLSQAIKKIKSWRSMKYVKSENKIKIKKQIHIKIKCLSLAQFKFLKPELKIQKNKKKNTSNWIRVKDLCKAKLIFWKEKRKWQNIK